MTSWRTSCRVDGCTSPPRKHRAWCDQHCRAVERGEAVEYAIFRHGLKVQVRDCCGTFTPFYGPDWWRRP